MLVHATLVCTTSCFPFQMRTTNYSQQLHNLITTLYGTNRCRQVSIRKRNYAMHVSPPGLDYRSNFPKLQTGLETSIIPVYVALSPHRILNLKTCKDANFVYDATSTLISVLTSTALHTPSHTRRTFRPILMKSVLNTKACASRVVVHL